jgi:putative holliday junction resolvase
VGLPLSLNGSEGKAAQLIRTEFVQLQALFEPMGIAVVVHDERFTTTTAHANLRERNLNAAKRRNIVDKVAAAVLLQNWLDGEKGRNL